MPSQFPAFRHNVALQMEAYRERLAKRIREEAAKHGESPTELAAALGVHSSTVERWFRAERFPQRRHRGPLAERWELPLDTFEPDIDAEDQDVRDQLDRIEEKLDEILKRLPAEIREGGGGLDDAEREAEQTSQDDQRSAQDADRSANQDQARQRESGAG
jgi:transcriptional regulator with XRE-family HTH domain